MKSFMRKSQQKNGYGNQVFLLPICSSHNALRNNTEYMILASNIVAIKLANYLN